MVRLALHGGGLIKEVDFDVNDLVEDLMVLVEVEMQMPVNRQQLHLESGITLDPSKSLKAQGIPENQTRAVIIVNSLFPRSAPAAQTQAPAVAGGGTANNNPQAQLDRLFSSPPPQQRPGTGQRSGAGRGAGGDNATDPQALLNQLFAGGGGGRGMGMMQQPSYVDENDADVQRRLMEEIEKKNLEENLMNALEHTPEAFASVTMLYCKAQVNKNDVTAFIDSGAQMTIMNEATAEKCGILRLLDRRMQGVAVGVGSSKILGRIHMALVTLGPFVVPMSITVLESQDMDFLIGLDQLKRHQMCIDLKDNALRMGDQAVPFLTEGELPEKYRKGLGAQRTPTAPTAPPVPSATDGPQPAQGPATAGGASAPSQQSAPQQLDPAKQAMVQQLVELAGVDAHTARSTLEACAWNVDTAAGVLLQ